MIFKVSVNLISYFDSNLLILFIFWMKSAIKFAILLYYLFANDTDQAINTDCYFINY